MTVQIDKYVQRDLDAMHKAMALDAVIEITIPIYTSARPNPKSGKWDCNITRNEKNRFRQLMKQKLMAALTDEERQKVIDHYKQLFSE